MLLDELMEQLTTTPGTARVVVMVGTTPAYVDRVVYQNGEVVITLDFDGPRAGAEVFVSDVSDEPELSSTVH